VRLLAQKDVVKGSVICNKDEIVHGVEGYDPSRRFLEVMLFVWWRTTNCLAWVGGVEDEHELIADISAYKVGVQQGS
jgi:hypothetical protein